MCYDLITKERLSNIECDTIETIVFNLVTFPEVTEVKEASFLVSDFYEPLRTRFR